MGNGDDENACAVLQIFDSSTSARVVYLAAFPLNESLFRLSL